MQEAIPQNYATNCNSQEQWSSKVCQALDRHVLRSLNGAQLLSLRPEVKHKWYPIPKPRHILS